jgi:hypothetical protein
LTRIAISDESGLHAEGLCYGIGGFVLPETVVPQIERQLARIWAEHGIVHELKWTNLRRYLEMERW